MTSTSDSIPARLSRGEFVIRAAAVRRYGVQFMAALNGMRLRVPAFARGGMVLPTPTFKMGVPAFAGGGLVPAGMAASGFGENTGGNAFTLVIGGQTFTGLQASDDAMSSLQRFTNAKMTRSLGRKPSWSGRT